MSTATELQLERREGRWVPLFLVASLVVHGAGFWGLTSIERTSFTPAPKPLELVMVDIPEPTPVPEPVPEPEPEPEPVVPPKPAPKPVAPPPIKVAAAVKPVEPPPENLPPPPNDAPPPEPSAKPPVLVVGISMSSTSSAGDFAAPVGNTVYGKTDSRASDPADVKAYKSEKGYVPVYQVDQAPVPLREVKAEYPREARMAGVEGSVVLAVTIEPSGEVSAVKVVKGGLGYGLEETARQALLKYRFRPATRNGEPVGTTIQFTYTWLLD